MIAGYVWIARNRRILEDKRLTIIVAGVISFRTDSRRIGVEKSPCYGGGSKKPPHSGNIRHSTWDFRICQNAIVNRTDRISGSHRLARSVKKHSRIWRDHDIQVLVITSAGATLTMISYRAPTHRTSHIVMTCGKYPFSKQIGYSDAAYALEW